MKKIAILGAGISGLTAAWRYHQTHEVTVFEKNSFAGGHIQTIEKDGFRFERGPRGFRPRGKGKATLQLVKELGIENELIESDAKERYLYLDGKLEKITPFFLFRLGFFQSCLKELKVTPGQYEESIGEFFQRRMGKKITDTLIDPLVTGIFGGSLWEISLKAVWPHLLAWEKAHGSIVKGYMRSKKEKGPLLLSFKTGMSRLPQRLVELLEKKIKFKEAVEKIEWKGNKILINGSEFDSCICSLPTYVLENLLPIKSLAYLPMATINLGWHKKVLPKKGFGYLVPSKEKEAILGVTFDSHIFESPGTKLCVMMKEPSLEKALEALQRHLAIVDKPDVVDVHFWPKAIPLYQKGHQDVLTQYNFPLMHFVGNYLSGVGINDCIYGK